MQKNKSAHRAWNLIRLAFLWARKRRVFRKRHLMQLRLLPKFIKSLTFKHSNHPKAITYKEHQFSFDTSPLVSFKKFSPSSMRLRFPCLRKARVDFEYDYHEYDFLNVNNNDDEEKKGFLTDHEHEDDDDSQSEILEEMLKCHDNDHDDTGDGEEIDAKAEHFIAQFYEQMRLQKQLSYARYKEMLNRGMR